MPDETLRVRKLSHEEARMEQLIFWSRKTVPERLAAGAALTRRLYRMQGIDIDEFKTDLTPRRVARSKR